MDNKLTKEIAYQEIQNFFQDKPFVLFGTGMSCAVDSNFGMAALESELKGKLNHATLSPKQEDEWKSVSKSLDDGVDFETAMDNVKDNDLINKIVKVTGDYIVSLDHKYSTKILTGETNWPASLLLKKLVDKTPGTDRELHVATPNYDMLAEYAFTNSEIPYINGFYGGIVRHFDWEQSRRGITYVEKAVTGKKVRKVTREYRHVRLYKVHGSLNWFLMNDDLLENNAWLYAEPPNEAERLIVTPGLSKYEKLHQFRNELLAKYDSAVEKHSFFIFLGFGFNDKQLYAPSILKKLKNQKCNSIIITKDSNDRIDKLLTEAENLWLICQANNGTIIKNRKYSAPLLLQNEKLWQVDIFTRIILGG